MPWGDGGLTGAAPAGGSGGFGSGGLANPSHAPAAKPKSGGGTFGFIGDAAHWVGQKADLAGRDLKAIPGGALDLIKYPTLAAYYDVTGNQAAAAKNFEKANKAVVGGAKAQVVQAATHPLRDPFQTLLTVAPFLHVPGTAVARGTAAVDAARAGEGAAGAVKAFATKPVTPPRLLKVGDTQVPLHPSDNPTVRAARALYDKALQRAVDTNPEGRLAGHAMRRVAGSMAETARYQQRIREVPANLLDEAAKKLAPTGGRVPGTGANRLQRVEQAALELTSVNTSAEDASRYHLGQAAKGVEPKQNLAVAKLYQAVANRGLLTKNAAGDVIVSEAHPKLMAADLRLATVQGKGDEILTRYGVRSPEGLQTRIDAPAQVRAGAKYVAPTAARVGDESPALKAALDQRDRLAAQHEKVLAQEAKYHAGGAAAKETERLKPGNKLDYLKSPKGLPAPSNPFRNKIVQIGIRLEAAQQRADALTAAAERRVQPTGFVGGDTARPGRGFTSYAIKEPKGQPSPVSSSIGPVVGEAKAPVSGATFKGEGIEQGQVPNDVTGQAARHYRQILKFMNTSEFRMTALATGSDVRRTSRDVLVKVPGEDHATIPPSVEAILGKSRLTTDDVAGIHAALDAYRQELIPGLKNHFAEDNAAGIGEPAPGGHRWVDRLVLGDLGKARMVGPRGRVAAAADTLNSSVTAATVYFKLGHIGTRVLTNAATNIIQGSASPLQIADSLKLWKALSREDKLRAFAASGQHGFSAMPHEGVNLAARVAGKGAQWWAKHADAPFRFNSIAYEARKAGYDTPAKFRSLLHKLEDPSGLSPAEFAKVDRVAKEANRAGIAYDRLNDAERRYVTRGLWFYNWIKGATVFAGRTLLEHPYRSAALGQAGQLGRQEQQKLLGNVPSYEGGLIPFGGGKVADFSTFSPFSTPADVINAVARPKEGAGFLNPVLDTVLHLIQGQNSLGQQTTHPYSAALSTLTAPTPEAQILAAYFNRGKDQSKRMFPADPAWNGTYNAVLRALLGPAVPRKYNPSAGESAYARERAGR